MKEDSVVPVAAAVSLLLICTTAAAVVFATAFVVANIVVSIFG